jgi:hypothetical protein
MFVPTFVVAAVVIGDADAAGVGDGDVVATFEQPAQAAVVMLNINTIDTIRSLCVIDFPP